MPKPTDLTPAHTSSAVAPGLGWALRTRNASVEEIVAGIAPGEVEIPGETVAVGRVPVAIQGFAR